MTYSPTKPDIGPSPKLDAPQIRTNFTQFNTAFALNHTSLNDRFQGDHEDVILTNQADPTLSGDETILYSKSATATTGGPQPQLFAMIPNFLPIPGDTTKLNAPIGMQLTYNSVNIAGPQYQSFLPGGYILYFGSGTGNSTITLSPAPTAILVAIATATTALSGGLPNQASTTNITATQFDVKTTGTTFVWYAIAKA